MSNLHLGNGLFLATRALALTVHFRQNLVGMIQTDTPATFVQAVVKGPMPNGRHGTCGPRR